MSSFIMYIYIYISIFGIKAAGTNRILIYQIVCFLELEMYHGGQYVSAKFVFILEKSFRSQSLIIQLLMITVTKIKQERTNQVRTKICLFFDFIRRFSIFLLGILNISWQLSCGAILKISSKNIEKCRRKSKKGPILVLFLLILSCLIFVTVTCECMTITS